MLLSEERIRIDLENKFLLTSNFLGLKTGVQK